MSEPKFTKGPYTSVPYQVFSPTGESLALVRQPHGAEIGTLLANLDLFAASWELYQALYDIRMSNAGTEQRKRGWDNALVALDKATGVK